MNDSFVSTTHTILLRFMESLYTEKLIPNLISFFYFAVSIVCALWLTGTQVREDPEPQCILSVSTDFKTEIERGSLLPRSARLPALYATSPDAVCQAADITKKALNFEHSTPIGVTCLKFNAFNFYCT